MDYLVQWIYERQLKAAGTYSTLDTLVLKYLKKDNISSEEIVNEAIFSDSCRYLLSSEKTIKDWKFLLSLLLLNHQIGSKDDRLANLVYQFEAEPWNHDSQYLRLYVALNHVLVDMPIPEIGIRLLESGAALIDIKEYSPWLSLPYSPERVEFGILLALIVLLLGRTDLKGYLLQIATWQLNTLDASFLPISSLYGRESETRENEVLILNYLFFSSIASITNECLFQTIAYRLSCFIQEKVSKDDGEYSFHPLWVIVESFFTIDLKSTSSFNLPQEIRDPLTALVGYRSLEKTAIATTHGFQTGLGYFRSGEVEIANYGPNYFPLDNSKGFGIEGNYLSDHGIRQSFIQTHSKGFSLKGCVRIVDKPVAVSEDIFRGLWLEVLQEFNQGTLTINTGFLAFDSWQDVAFCFFIKAEECAVEKENILLGQLKGYEGPNAPLIFRKNQSFIQIEALKSVEKLQIIPLGGGDNFWGATFLLAYYLLPEQKAYAWSIKSLDSIP